MKARGGAIHARANIDKGLMLGQCIEQLQDKLEIGSNLTAMLAAKDMMALDDMIWTQTHEMMDIRRKKAWTAIDVKAAVLNYHQEHHNLNDINFYWEFIGRIQGLKTAKVTIGCDKCIVDETLRQQGVTQVTAIGAQKEAAVSKAEEQIAVLMQH
mmetsp:Transcript_19934/g.41685  ORF Transcript_19934/g.41685 Transcript_19934/m.41685 type:complete len:155 (-) Transcript_19934:233-697(-)